jgi:cytochrome c oxidase assembly factor CtaG
VRPRGGPWAFHPHPLALVAVALVTAGALWAQQATQPRPARRHQRRLLAGGALALFVAVWWPLADLAAHWSLLALVVQRLLLTLVAAPLLLAALPAETLARLTRPLLADRALEVLTLPAVAVALFTLVAVGTLLPPAVAFDSAGGWHAGLFDAVLLGAGLVLWGPVLEHVPGTSRPGPLGVAVYLVVQSLVPTFLALVFVFARHPLYPAYARAGGAIGLSPLADQEVAGIVGKVGTLPILWTVAWRELARARRAEETGQDTRPLRWLDVERRLARAERRERRALTRSHRTARRPPRQRRRVLARPQLVAYFPTIDAPAAEAPAVEPHAVEPGPPAGSSTDSGQPLRPDTDGEPPGEGPSPEGPGPEGPGPSPRRC